MVLCQETFLAAENSNITPLPAVPVPPENPITEEKRILGKILFWEEQLSSDNSIACGSCHMPAAGGADPRAGIHPGPDSAYNSPDDVLGSPGVVARDSNGNPIEHSVFGFNVQVTDRAAPTNIGAQYSKDLFWDGRATSQFLNPETGSVVIASGGALESQAIEPILNPAEMAQQRRTWADVRNKLLSVEPLALASNFPPDISNVLTADTDYPALFTAAFGNGTITAARIAMALATYQRTLVPDQSPWDKYAAGDLSAMSEEQLAGWEQFQRNLCAECHIPPTFSDDQYYNVGLRPSPEDLGRQIVTGNPLDRGRFRTPTLRNVGLKQGLGHLGWLTDTQDVIDFYNAGANPSVSTHSQFYFDQSRTPRSNLHYSAIQIAPTNLEIQEQVREFIDKALTDPRVEAEQFPFDRPTLSNEARRSN